MSSKIKNLKEEKEATLLTLIHHQANQTPRLLLVEVGKSIAKSEKGDPTPGVLPPTTGRRSTGKDARKRRTGETKRIRGRRSQRRKDIPEHKIQLLTNKTKCYEKSICFCISPFYVC